MRRTQLTEIDVHSALVFERYGSEEVSRRARQRPTLEKQVLCNKKRFGGSSDAYWLLEFWHAALNSPHVNVLHTLAAHRKSTAEKAAMDTLKKQTAGSSLAMSDVLQRTSVNNGIKSAQALVSLVGRLPSDIPALVAFFKPSWMARGNKGDVAIGMTMMENKSVKNILHTCIKPPKDIRPTRAAKMCIAWSLASTTMTPSHEDAKIVPGFFERQYQLLKNKKKLSARHLAALQRVIEEESEYAMPTIWTGTTRSFISLITHLRNNKELDKCASQLVIEAQELHQKASHDLQHNSLIDIPYLCGISQNDKTRMEPLNNTGSPLSIGLGNNESLRRWMAGKTRKNDPCLKHLGTSHVNEFSKACARVLSSEPIPLLTITNFNIDVISQPDESSSQIGACLHVCGDGVIRVVDAIRETVTRSTEKELAHACMQTRAALAVASSQASYIGDVGSSLAAGYSNAAIASSKKITIADNNKLFMLSVQDCYVSGLTNIEKSLEGSAYVGAYGSRIDTGFTMPGLFAHNLRSDRRQHGNCCLSQDVADSLAGEFAKQHWVYYTTDEKTNTNSLVTNTPHTETMGDNTPKISCCARPVATRGIPHGFIPGVHSVLNDYCNFLTAAREASKRTDQHTIDSIVVLPFSPFSQALTPDIESSVDLSLRTCIHNPQMNSTVTGRAYLSDATEEENALCTEPLFRRPQQVSSGDCPFATGYANADSFWNLCNHIAERARLTYMFETSHKPNIDAIDHIHQLITFFVTEDNTQNLPSGMAYSMLHAADMLLLINALFPSETGVGKLALLPCYAKAVPICARAFTEGNLKGMTLQQIEMEPGEREKGRMFWKSFCRVDTAVCAWESGVKPLLKLIYKTEGSHNINKQLFRLHKAQFERAVRAVWLVHSKDGHSPPSSPSQASTAPSPAHIARHHIDPTFVGDEANGLMQKASIIGLKPHTLRQLLASMLGATLVDACNVAINEGGLSLRVSSDPTINDANGCQRSLKGISPVQTDADEAAYGKRTDKIEGAIRQKEAW